MNHRKRRYPGPRIGHAYRARRSRSGMTMLELTVAMVIATVAVSIFSGTVVATARQRGIHRERAIAADAARSMLEIMRNQPFSEIYARFNENPDDDPAGPGTAPRHRFVVEGLTPEPGVFDGMAGQIEFPTVDVSAFAAIEAWELREDVVNRSLGMPRDLNGDLLIDSLDHADDYRLLPVSVRVRWNGAGGVTEIRKHTMLIEFGP